MKLTVSHQPLLPPSASPYRLLDACGQEIGWVNTFLDAQRIRQLSARSLRTYAFDLLHFARWLVDHPPPLAEPHPLDQRNPLAELHPLAEPHPLAGLTQALLRDYVRYQIDQSPPPSPQTVNRRLIVVERLYRFHHGQEIPAGQFHFQRYYTQRSALGYGRPRRVISRSLRLKQPRRLVQPLTVEQVSQFWNSFRTFRDLAIVGLMLLDGLRCCEVLTLQRSDLLAEEAQMRVWGKGNRQRLLPLPHDIVDLLRKYLLVERPVTSCQSLFVCLKGPRRGHSLTAAGLRSLFRHHRRSTGVCLANPHRFRHTFGADMVRAGISLPALQQLMGHSQIQTTMLYVQLSPQDVWSEFSRAVKNRDLDTPSL
jgi:site-specific recombinase XerD